MLNRMRVKCKLNLLIAVIIGIMTLVVLISVFQSMGSEKTIARMVDEDLALLISLNEMHAQGIQTGQATRNVLINPADVKAAENYLSAHADFLERFEQVDKHAPKIMRDRLAKLKVLWEEDHQLKMEVQQLAKDGRQQEAMDVLIDKETPKWREVKALILKLLEEHEAMFAQIKEQEIAGLRKNRNMQIAVFLMAAACSIFLALLIGKGITQPLNQGVQAATRLAEGDLAIDVRVESTDEAGQLVAAIKTMAHQFSEIVTGAKAISDNVALSSRQLSAGA
jgi:methyl-accepting chemotaxis protein